MNKDIKQATLEQVAEAFKTWRDLKVYRREKTPPHLWELVRAIAPFYPRRKIEIALSITKEQLDREAPISRLDELTHVLPQRSGPEFIELSMPASIALGSSMDAVLTITRDDGSSWMLSAASQAVISESLRLFLRN